jgi:hypothetical protein
LFLVAFLAHPPIKWLRSYPQNNLQCIFGIKSIDIFIFFNISTINLIKGIVFRKAVLSAMYSDSVDDCAISVCNCDAYTIRHPAYIMT